MRRFEGNRTILPGQDFAVSFPVGVGSAWKQKRCVGPNEPCKNRTLASQLMPLTRHVIGPDRPCTLPSSKSRKRIRINCCSSSSTHRHPDTRVPWFLLVRLEIRKQNSFLPTRKAHGVQCLLKCSAIAFLSCISCCLS